MHKSGLGLAGARIFEKSFADIRLSCNLHRISIYTYLVIYTVQVSAQMTLSRMMTNPQITQNVEMHKSGLGLIVCEFSKSHLAVSV